MSIPVARGFASDVDAVSEGVTDVGARDGDAVDPRELADVQAAASAATMSRHPATIVTLRNTAHSLRDDGTAGRMGARSSRNDRTDPPAIARGGSGSWNGTRR